MLRSAGPSALLSARLPILGNSLPNATSGEESTVVPEMAQADDPLRPRSTRELSCSRCSGKNQHVGHSQLTSTSRARWQHAGARQGSSGISRPRFPKERSPLRSERQAFPPGVAGTSTHPRRDKARSYSSSTPQPDTEPAFHTAQCKGREAAVTCDRQSLLWERATAAGKVLLPNVGRRDGPAEGQKGSSGSSRSGLLPLEPL